MSLMATHTDYYTNTVKTDTESFSHLDHENYSEENSALFRIQFQDGRELTMLDQNGL